MILISSDHTDGCSSVHFSYMFSVNELFDVNKKVSQTDLSQPGRPKVNLLLK